MAKSGGDQIKWLGEGIARTGWVKVQYHFHFWGCCASLKMRITYINGFVRMIQDIKVYGLILHPLG